jgi:hypothetical protein
MNQESPTFIWKSRGENNARSKLTEEMVRYIRKSDSSTKELMQELELSKATINDVKARRTWWHVK